MYSALIGRTHTHTHTHSGKDCLVVVMEIVSSSGRVENNNTQTLPIICQVRDDDDDYLLFAGNYSAVLARLCSDCLYLFTFAIFVFWRGVACCSWQASTDALCFPCLSISFAFAFYTSSSRHHSQFTAFFAMQLLHLLSPFLLILIVKRNFRLILVFLFLN